MTNNSDNPTHKSRLSSCAIWAAIPCVLFIVLVLTYTINNRPPNIHIPTHKMPKDNGWDYFTRAASLGKGGGPVSSDRPQNSWTLAELQKFMQDNTLAFAEVRVGLTKPYMHPPMRDYSSLEDTYKHYARTREVARLLLSSSMYYERIGEPYKAVCAHLDAVEMGVTFPRGGTLIAGLVGVAIEAIGLHGSEAQIRKLTNPELAATAHRLEGIQAKRVPYAEVVLEEGRESVAHQLQLARVPTPGLPTPGATSGPTPAGIWVNTRFLFQNKSSMISANQAYYAAVAAEARKSYTGKSSVPIPNNVFAQMAGDTAVKARMAFVSAESATTVIQTEVAVLRYHADHGTYPTRLSDLTPKYLKTIPIDPWGRGRPLIYRPTKGGKSFLLYSRGPNLKDDGGTPAQPPAISSHGDMVAGKLN